jgi:hypothetical protein
LKNYRLERVKGQMTVSVRDSGIVERKTRMGRESWEYLPVLSLFPQVTYG